MVIKKIIIIHSVICFRVKFVFLQQFLRIFFFFSVNKRLHYIYFKSDFVNTRMLVNYIFFFFESVKLFLHFYFFQMFLLNGCCHDHETSDIYICIQTGWRVYVNFILDGSLKTCAGGGLKDKWGLLRKSSLVFCVLLAKPPPWGWKIVLVKFDDLCHLAI